MSVHDAKAGDIYVDAVNRLWRCIGTISEPSVIMEEVEPTACAADAGAIPPPNARCSGDVSGLMWSGWKRIYRPEPMR